MIDGKLVKESVFFENLSFFTVQPRSINKITRFLVERYLIMAKRPKYLTETGSDTGNLLIFLNLSNVLQDAIMENCGADQFKAADSQ